MRFAHVAKLAAATAFAGAQFTAIAVADETEFLAKAAAIVAGFAMAVALLWPAHNRVTGALIAGALAPMLAVFGHDRVVPALAVCGVLLIVSGELVSCAADARPSSPGADDYVAARLRGSLGLVAAGAAAAGATALAALVELPGGVVLVVVAAGAVCALGGLIAASATR